MATSPNSRQSRVLRHLSSTISSPSFRRPPVESNNTRKTRAIRLNVSDEKDSVFIGKTYQTMAESEWDFSRTCRTCRCETEELNSVFGYFEKDGGNARIDEMLMACASVQVCVVMIWPGAKTDYKKRLFLSFKNYVLILRDCEINLNISACFTGFVLLRKEAMANTLKKYACLFVI